MKITPLKSKITDFANTVSLLPARLADVAKAPNSFARDPREFSVNKVAAALHPKKQELVITGIDGTDPDFKAYRFAPAKGGHPAYFRAGQYLSFQIEIGCSVVTRAYSIASSPEDALNGEYMIAVKRVPDGFVSGYILDNWKVGDKVTAFAPEGTFTYEPLRDAKTVVAAAGGSGITPFLSMAKAISEGTEDFELVLLYGAKTKKDLMFKDELDAIAEKCEKVKVVYVLSNSNAKGFERGFINASLIKKYAPEGEYSLFVCGPAAMYKFIKGQLEELGLRKKFVRFELQGVSKDEAKNAKIEEKEYTLTVINRGETAQFPCGSAETVLTALEKAGVAVPVRCRSGECGFCRSKVISGSVYIPEGIDYRRIADAKFNYIHPCCCFPVSDITIKIN